MASSGSACAYPIDLVVYTESRIVSIASETRRLEKSEGAGEALSLWRLWLIMDGLVSSEGGQRCMTESTR